MDIVRIAVIAAIGAFAVACESPQPVSQSSGATLPIPSGSQSSQSGSQSSSQGSQSGQSGSQSSSQGSQSGQSASTSGGNVPTGGQQTAGNNQDGSGQDGSGQDGSGQEGSGENEAGGDNPFGDGQAMGSAGSSGAGDAFGDSLEEFDEEMGQAQEELARAGGGSAADEQAGGRDGEGRGPGSAEDGGVAAATGPDPRLIPGRGDAAVEGCDDEDYVARQLCEYATKETDAFARAELWREYEEYVRILREQ